MSELGVKNGQLAALPSKPNAVSTQTDQQDKKMKPLPFKGDLAATKNLVRNAIHSMERSEIEADEPNYIHAVFTSKLMKFKDDVEFYFDETAQLVHFRSASRVGHSDFGVNRKRMEQFTTIYMEG